MQRSAVTTVIGILVLTLAWPVAADDGWSMPNLNPFASKPKPKARTSPTRKVSDTKSSGWSLNPFAKSAPSKGSNGASSSSRRKNEPSMITKTWESITPWEERPAKKHAPATGYGSTAKQKKSKSSNEKGWFDSLFGTEEPRKNPTADEWIARDRPG